MGHLTPGVLYAVSLASSHRLWCGGCSFIKHIGPSTGIQAQVRQDDLMGCLAVQVWRLSERGSAELLPARELLLLPAIHVQSAEIPVCPGKPLPSKPSNLVGDGHTCRRSCASSAISSCAVCKAQEQPQCLQGSTQSQAEGRCAATKICCKHQKNVACLGANQSFSTGLCQIIVAHAEGSTSRCRCLVAVLMRRPTSGCTSTRRTQRRP